MTLQRRLEDTWRDLKGKRIWLVVLKNTGFGMLILVAEWPVELSA
jgi:hypothetical protein